MLKINFESVSFMAVLLVLAAAIGLWALRAWNRSRRVPKPNPAEKVAAIAKLGPGPNEKKPRPSAGAGIIPKPVSGSSDAGGKRMAPGS